MKTFLVIAVTAAITWITVDFIHGVRIAAERVWLRSAVKVPGRMALSEIQTDLDAEKYALAKAKLDALAITWQRFDSSPDTFQGSGIGDIMVTFSKLDINSNSTPAGITKQGQ